MDLGLIIQRRSHFPLGVAGMNRNGRPEWTGMGGRNQSESVAGMRRNTHLPVYYENGRPRVRKYELNLWMIEIQKLAFQGKERAELARLEKEFFDKMDHKQKMIDEELNAFQGKPPLSGEARGDISKPMDPASVPHGPLDRGHPDLNFWFFSLRHGSSS